jgi:predicted HicB family RNase H-like nuclease
MIAVVKESPAGGRKKSTVLGVRLPMSLHARIVELAAQEGVSLNHFVSYLLSTAIASREVSG